MGIFKPFVLAICSLPFVSSGFVTPILQNHLPPTKSLCFPNEVNDKTKQPLDMSRSNGDKKEDWRSEFEKIIFGLPSCRRNPESSRSPIPSSTIDTFIGTLCLAGIGIPWEANAAAAGNDAIYLLPSTTNAIVGYELAAIMVLLAFPGMFAANQNEPQYAFAMDNFNYGNQFPGGRTPSPQPAFPIRPPAPPQQPNPFSASNSPMPRKSYLKKAKSSVRKVKKIKPMANPAAYLNNAPAPSPSWLSNPFNPSPPENTYGQRAWDSSNSYDDYGMEIEEEESFPKSILSGVSSFFNNFRISLPGSNQKDNQMADNYDPNFTPMQQRPPMNPARVKKTKVLGPSPGDYGSATNNMPSQMYSQNTRSKGSAVTFAPPDLKSNLSPVTAQKKKNSQQYNYYENSQGFPQSQATTYKDNYGYQSSQNSFGNNSSPNFSPKRMLPGVNFASQPPANSYYDQQPYYDQQSYTQGQPRNNASPNFPSRKRIPGVNYASQSYDDQQPYNDQQSYRQGQSSRNMLSFSTSDVNRNDQPPPRYQISGAQQNQQSYYNEAGQAPQKQSFFQRFRGQPKQQPNQETYYNDNYEDRYSSPYSSGSMGSTRNKAVSFAAPDVKKGSRNSGRPQSGYPMQNMQGDYQTNDGSSSSGLFNNMFNKGNRSLKKTKVFNDQSMGRQTYQTPGAQQRGSSFSLGSDDVARSTRPPPQSTSNQFMNASGQQGTFANNNNNNNNNRFNSATSKRFDQSNFQGPPGTNQNKQSSSPGLFNMFNRGNEQAASPTQSSSSQQYGTVSNQQSYDMNNARPESDTFSLSSDNVVRTNRPIAAKARPQNTNSFTGNYTPNNQFPPTSKKSTMQKQPGNGIFNNMFNKGNQPLKKTAGVGNQSMGNRFNTPVTSPPPFQRNTNAPNQQSFQSKAKSGTNSFSLGSDNVNRFKNPGAASFSSSNQYSTQPNQSTYNFKNVKSGNNQFSASSNGMNRFTTPVASPQPFSQRSMTSQNQQPFKTNTVKQGGSSFSLGSDNVTRSNRPPVQSNSMNIGGPQGTFNTGNRSSNLQGPPGTKQNKQSSSPGLFNMFNRGNKQTKSPTQSSYSQQYGNGPNQQSYGTTNAVPGRSPFSLSSDNVASMNRPIGQTPQISSQGATLRNTNIPGKSSSTFTPGSMGSTQNGPSFNNRGILGNKQTSSKKTASGMTYFSPASSQGARLTPPVSAPAQRFGTSSGNQFTSGPQNNSKFTGNYTPNNQFPPTSKKSTMQKQPGNGIFNNMFNKGNQPLKKTAGVGNQSMGNRFNTPVTSPPPFQRNTNAPNQQSFQNAPNSAANGIQNESSSGGLFNMFNRRNAPLKKTKLAGSPGQYAPTTKKSYMQRAKTVGNGFSLGSDDVERFNRPMPSSISTSQNSWQ